MSGSIRDAIKQYSPKWLQGPVGEKLVYAIGLALDALGEKMNEGMKLHIPTYGDYSALPTIGDDRLIPQGPNESAPNYALRLRSAYDDWSLAGSARSLMRQFLGNVSPSTPLMRVVGSGTASGTPWDFYVAGASTTAPPVHYRAVPANWIWDGTYAGVPAGGGLTYRAWLIIDCSSGAPFTSEGTWADGQTWGDGGAWGTTATPNQVTTMRSIASLWKDAGITVTNIILSYDSTLFDHTKAFGSAKLPDGNFGQWQKVSSSGSAPSRFSSAAYMDGAT